MSSINFDRAADFYDATRGYPASVPEQICEAIVRLTGADKETRFFEAGVGTGRIALPFIQAGYNYTGIDISEEMMARLRAKLTNLSDLNSARYNIRQGDITALPFPENSFDVILVVHVLHLVDNWKEAINELQRVLRKPQGWLLIAHDDRKETDTPAQVIRNKWTELKIEMGLSDPEREKHRHWGESEQIFSYLQEIGALLGRQQLVEYLSLPISKREMAVRLINRMYSSDWHHNDEAHREIVIKFNEWFEKEVADPDIPVTTPSHFSVLTARWL